MRSCRNLFGAIPLVNCDLISFFFRHQAASEITFGAGDNLVRLLQDLRPFIGNRQIANGNGRAGNRRVMESVVLDRINNLGGDSQRR